MVKTTSAMNLLVALATTTMGSSNAFITPPAGQTAITSTRHKTVKNHQMNAFVDPSLFSDAVSSAFTLLSDETATSIVETATDAVTTSSSAADSAAAVQFAGDVSYSKASYYTVLALYVMSFPGIWSQIKRSTTAKIKRKTFVTPGENAAPAAGTDVSSSTEEGTTSSGVGKALREQAGEIMAYMKANNYEVVDAGETITFRGLVQRSTSQAFFLVFCTALGLASLALVLQIQFQDLTLPGIGKPNWFYLVALSPYAGVYYWKAGDRVDDCTVKLLSNDDETENEITVQGSDEEIERMWRTLGWQEKGMVKVEGILES